ncbi:hypothetical protein [Dechloromonas denitrificans]|uniref:hypothetical protein n=1 Tax=Dechloromonas denitrificans TaxID=281362 RepID=UPI0012FC8D0B|nr:hypothetical protein [Dechloromonas denitrificans]
MNELLALPLLAKQATGAVGYGRRAIRKPQMLRDFGSHRRLMSRQWTETEAR